MNSFSFRPAGSDHNLCSDGHAVDRFIHAVKRPFGNTPLFTRHHRGVFRYQRAGEEARLRKVVSPRFRDHLA